MYSKEILLKDVKKSWLPLLDNQELDKIIKKLNTYKTTIYPEPKNIFECFKYFELHETKVVFLGQDPYINECEAMGLSFSVPINCKLPPSLKNIYKELNIDSTNGDLTNWAISDQFLMLNTSLTVFAKQSNSHTDIWKDYTDQLITNISTFVPKTIFLLLGNHAQSKLKFIDSKHIIITGVHPSPLSAYRGFFGSNIFEKLEKEYKNLFKKSIDWS